MSEESKKKLNWTVLLVLVVGVVLLAGSFYWFQLRPTSIKKKCSTEAENASTYIEGEVSTNDVVSKAKLDSKKYADEYRVCLQRNGLVGSKNINLILAIFPGSVRT